LKNTDTILNYLIQDLKVWNYLLFYWQNNTIIIIGTLIPSHEVITNPKHYDHVKYKYPQIYPMHTNIVIMSNNSSFKEIKIIRKKQDQKFS
jgi:hypothetical protein